MQVQQLKAPIILVVAVVAVEMALETDHLAGLATELKAKGLGLGVVPAKAEYGSIMSHSRTMN
jgi:acyl CoA:acetate/3-ketoacid CoA transferase alpha subunit